MNAVNAVQLLILVWIFPAVCRADDDVCSVTCKDVTGTVGEEVIFTCNVSLKRSECCITKYKFLYPEIYNDTEICKQELPQGSCEQRNSFTCRYTPTSAMMRQFRFFVQTTCGRKITEFTVDITEASKPETVNKAPHREIPSPTGEVRASNVDNPGSNGTVIAAVMGCFFIIISIIIMAIIYKRKPNYIKLSRLQKWMSLDRGQEQSPQNENNIIDLTV